MAVCRTDFGIFGRVMIQVFHRQSFRRAHPGGYQIQRAMRTISRQRTTFLITHRLSQIRWADRILVLRGGRLVDQGTHEELLARSEDYSRIFARRG